jgi:hypothetical protein
MRQNSRALWFGIGLVCLLLGGCYKESVSGDVTTITYAWWMLPLSVAGCVVASIIGWLTRNAEGRAWWFSMFMLLGGPVALVCFVPKLVVDKVTVDSQQLTVRAGFWFSPTTMNAKFADTQRFLLITEISRGRRGRENKNHYLECVSKSQQVQRVSIDELLSPALDKIVEQAMLHNISVDDHRK